MNKKRTKAETVSLLAIFTNVILTAVKFLLALFTGSLALLAEASHSFADIGSSIAVFLAVRADAKNDGALNSKETSWWTRNPQRKVAILIGLFLLCVGVGIGLKVFQYEAIKVQYPAISGIVMLLLALGSFLLSRLELFVGKQEGATALEADGHHARVDMYGSLLVAFALFGESLSLQVDRIASGVLALFILTEAFNVFVAVVKDLRRKEEAPVLFHSSWTVNLWKRYTGFAGNWINAFVAKLMMLPDSDPKRNAKVGRVLYITFLVIVIAGYFSLGVFTLDAHQKGVVEHFGKPVMKGKSVAVYEPGIHYCWPWPIDRVVKVDSLRLRRLIVGSELSPESETMLWTNVHYLREHNILTGENIFVDAGMTLHYRVSDPAAFIYSSVRPETILQEIAYEILLKRFANRKFFHSITEGRSVLEQELFQGINKMLQRYPKNLGIALELVSLRDVHPPTKVAPEFEEVVSATVDYDTYINQAHGYRADFIPRERGKAEVTRLLAQAESNKKKLSSKGESQRFLSLLNEYRNAPEVSRRRLILETTEKVLKGREKYIVPPEAAEGALDLYLFLDRKSQDEIKDPWEGRKRRFGEVNQ